LKINWSYNF